MKNVKIIDNFLNKDEFENLKNTLHSNFFPWMYIDSISFYKKNNVDYFLDNYCFTHLFYANNLVNSQFFDLNTPIIKKLKIFSLIKIQANMYTRTSKKIYHEWHTDSCGQKNINWNTAVYYVNSNNGNTILKNNNEDFVIESVENRIVIFPAETLHRSTSSSDTKIRTIINFNYY